MPPLGRPVVCSLPRVGNPNPSPDPLFGSSPPEERKTLEKQYPSGSSRFKLFLLSLALTALGWYRELAIGAVDFWTRFVMMFISRFMALRDELPTVGIVRKTKHGDKEPLKGYLEKCSQVTGGVRSLSEEVQVISLRRGPRKGPTPGLDTEPREPEPIGAFTERAQFHIDYGAKVPVTNKALVFPVSGKGSMGHRLRYSEYNP